MKNGKDREAGARALFEMLYNIEVKQCALVYKDEWREVAINKPELVAEYLYKFQDEGRFGADPRLLVVYIDEDVSIDKIREIINKTDLNNPVEINFTYKHKNLGEKNYKVPCFVILLHN